MRRSVCTIIAILAICFLVSTVYVVNLNATKQPENSTSRHGKPNIVLLMADDMGYECLSSNGSLSYSTPALDNLADNGIKFNFAFAQPLCTPSRVKIMTGKYNYRNYKAFTYLDVNDKTFGNLLMDAGYETCVIGKWQLNGIGKDIRLSSEKGDIFKRPNHFGFKEYCLWNFSENSGNRYANPKLFQNGKELAGLKDEYGPNVVSDYAVDFMDRNKEKPFFLYYPMILVHSPFVPTPDSEEWKDERLRNQKDNRFFKDMVEYTDKIVLKLVTKVEELGLSGKTMFIFTADNGTHYKLTTQTKNGPFQGGKGTMPNAGTHVPMIVFNPSKIHRGVEYNELFEFSDFLPTFAEAAGIPAPDGIDGKSFNALLNGQKQEDRETIFVHYDPLKSGGSERRYGRFVRNKKYKLYNDGRFYNVSNDSREQFPIPEEKLNPEEMRLKEAFQSELDTAPPHYFKQPQEYKEKMK